LFLNFLLNLWGSFPMLWSAKLPVNSQMKVGRTNVTTQAAPGSPEPWLRATLTELPPVPRAVLHALELAKEDLGKWCGSLSDAQLHERPGGTASVAFQLRHIARSVDRLLTYAEGGQLSQAQADALKSELDAGATHDDLFAELEAAWKRSADRVRALASVDLSTPRVVGKKQLPSTVGGLLVHIAEHTQRHVGQAITTAKIVRHHS
jgi:uncharacterized damage-inducible protein DinB